MPPAMLISSLEGLRRKVKLLGVAYGAGIALAVAVAGLLVASFLDYLLNLPALPRLTLCVIALGALGYVLWQYVLRPAMGRITLSDIAGKLENAFPQFDDRLRSTVDFLGAGQDNPGSDVMKQRVVSEAASLASQIDLNRAIVATPAWYSLGMGFTAVAVLVLLAAFVISDQYRNIALARLFTPFAQNAWPKRVEISVLGNMPTRVPVGQRLDVRMKLAKGDRESLKAIVFTQYDNGPVMQEYMTRAADGTYAASLDTRVEPGQSSASMKVWMKAGDDEVKLSPVTVVPRLSIKSVEAVVTPPPYVQPQRAATINLAAAPVMTAVGSQVQLRVNFNKPLAPEAMPTVEPMTETAHAPQIKWTRSEDNRTAVGAFTAAESLRFRIKATDTDQFSNSALEEFELIVRPDQMPLVQIEQPRRSEERTPVAVVPLQGLAEDDYGIQSLKLVVERPMDRKRWEVPLVTDSQPKPEITWTRADGAVMNVSASSGADRQRFRAAYNWDLAALKDAALKPGDVLEYYLEVRDNYLLNGQAHEPVVSGKLRINIISQDDLTNRVIDELRQAKEQIGNVRNAQNRTKGETENLAADTKDKPNLDPADRAAADRLTNQQATTATQTKSLAGRMDAIQQKLDENKSPAQELKDLARDVKSDLERAAEGPMRDATQQLSQTEQPNQTKEQRDQALADAQKNQTKASEQLQNAMDRMSNIGSLSQAIDRIAAILAEQKQVTKDTQAAGKDNIGKRPEDMKPEDRKKLDEAADRQNKLADRTAKAMDELKKTADQMQKSDPSASQAMNNAARTAQQQQVQPKQQQASQDAKQNKMSSAQGNQKQVELGLEMMLNELREAERARLAELSKKLEELQKQIAILIRRQAGHNLDNVVAQGEEVEKPETVSELYLKAERDPATPPVKVELLQQSQSQEQTERNTRDIGKSAEQLPNGAEPAGHLVRAAGKMERAIFSLRDRKLPEAYDPSQIEALAALESAKKIVDEQKAQVDDKLGEQDREAVRAKYAKIKEEQEKLNADTARIDGARDPQSHELARADAIKLGQLPGEQGKLADRVSAIDKDLAAVGSIVYLWANKDIVAAMNDVKSDLGKPETGAPTQAQEKRIVEQLDAMIRNLKTEPKQSKFAQNGGGGQCQGGAKLPTEAELRLLKDLQLVVNRNTKSADADAQARADKEELLNLGTRQGELRNLLDQLIQKASMGEIKLGPEPDKTQQLPEEAKEEDIDNQELDKGLLEDKPGDDSGEARKTQLVGDRMARSRQRLALNNDPGKVTQLIQDRIVKDLDDLIEQAREQQAQTRNNQQQKNGQKMPKPGNNMAQAQNQGKPKQNANSNPAARDSSPGVGTQKPQTDVSKNIEETMAEWGGVSKRVRDAVINSADDEPLTEYKQLIEDYWKSLSTKAKER